MDLSQLSTEALQDLQANGADISKVKTSTLKELQGAHPDTPKPVSLGDRAANAGLGAVQGATLGLGDELAGLGNSAIDTVGKATGLMDGKVDPVGDYAKYRDVARSQNDAAQKQSVGEYGAGQLLGSLAVPVGEVGSVGQAAAKFGGLGAAQGFGSSTGQGADLAKDTAIGAGLGAATGAGAQKLGQTLRAAPEALNDLAESSAVKSFNPSGPQMAKIQALPGGANAVGRNLLDKGVVSFGDTAEKSSAKLGSATTKAGQDIGAIYKAADAKAAPDQLLKADDFISAMEPTLRKLQGNAATRSLVPILEKQAQDIAETYGQNPITFQQAKELVSGMQSQAFSGAGLDPTIQKSLRQDVASALRSTVSNRVAEVMGNGDLQPANQAFSQLKSLEKPARSTLAGNKSNRAIGLTDYVSGGTGATVGGVAGGMAGGPVGAVVGSAIGAAAGGAANKILRTYGRAAMASGANSAAAGAEALASALDRGEPLASVIQKAQAIGLPREVIQSLQGGQNGSGSN